MPDISWNVFHPSSMVKSYFAGREILYIKGHYLHCRTCRELIQGHDFSYRAINNVVVSGSISLSGILLKASDNDDEERGDVHIEEKLGPRVETVLYGFCWREEFIGLSGGKVTIKHLG